MGKKKRIYELENKSEDSDSLDSDVDSDEELQKAYERGELTSGLNTVVALQRVNHVNNVNAINAKLNQFKLNSQWIERLDLVNGPAKMTPEMEQQYGDLSLKMKRNGEVSGEELNDKPEHDFKREMLFYRQAQGSVIEGIERLHKLKIATKRPDDYFAQMAKSDEHMSKVRANIVHRHTAMESSEKAKKMRELRKYGKRIQHEVLKKRQKEKREIMDKVKKFKKGQGQENLDFLDQKSGQKSKGTPTLNKVNQKKNYKEKRFGYGGQKKRSKYNTADSSSEMTTFKRNVNGKPMRKSGKKNTRPGKSKRQKMKKR